jgi:ABC-type antimicrobial peptide transport system permease subunit
MYISVLERTRIIGVFKALGAKKRTIMTLFLVEALLIGLIGGGTGFGVGAIMAYSAGGLLQNFTASSSQGGQASSSQSQVGVSSSRSQVGQASSSRSQVGVPMGGSFSMNQPRVGVGASSMLMPRTTSLAIEPYFPPWLILLALGFAVSVSLVAGFYPARKAAKLDPAIALRYE